MPNWRLAKSLIKLREQINAAHPDRSKVSDGTIGDPAHAARKSDHNPNAQGIVTAFDITHDPENGVNGWQLSQWAAADPRTKYVIWTGKIFKARTGQWEDYRGSNPHNKHVHVSVLADKCDDESSWKLNGGLVRSTLRRGDTGTSVQDLQRKLGIKTDGSFGPDTEKAVREFQSAHGLVVDGVAGKDTWKALDS